jgi:hypothetical protein
MRLKQITDLLDHYDIEHWEAPAKNVTYGWTNIRCPFCDDHSNHMGMDPDEELYNCWRCHESGGVEYLLSKVTGAAKEYITHLLKGGSTSFKKDMEQQLFDIFNPETKSERPDEIQEVLFPDYSSVIDNRTESPLLDYYCRRRKISRQTLMDHYCLICEAGFYKMRIIIPVFFGGEIVAWQAADMTGTAIKKYLMPPGIFINDFLYGYDDITKRMILTEGVLDKWRTLYDAVTTFGTSLTKRQRKLIKDKQLDELIFAWDGEAYEYALAEAQEVAPYINCVRIARLPWNKDPDELGFDTTWNYIDDAETI